MLDKIDEWLKKEFSQDSPREQTTSKQDHSKPQKGFTNNQAPKESGQITPNQGAQHKPHQGGQTNPNKAKFHIRSKSGEKQPKGKNNGRPNVHSKYQPQSQQRHQHHPRTEGKHKAAPLEKSEHSFPQMEKGKLRIIPLGGLEEVGKNMTAMEYENDIIIVDCGFEFPGEELPGIDYIVPDVSYLEVNKNRIKGVFLTHGHLDHIGGLIYVLPKIGYPPVYGLPLTLGLVEGRVKEFKQEKYTKLIKIKPEDTIKAGVFTCSFARVMHSIPDCVAIIVDTPVGKVVHSGDFKFDESPARNIQKADIDKLEALGKQNILAFLCESTNSIKPGHTISEKEVGEGLDQVVGSAENRLIVSSFSSQIGRLQQVIDAGIKHNRKIFVSGRSMTNNIEIAGKLGYINYPKDQIQDIKKYKPGKTPDKETLILTTGSQGEPVAALARIARGEHSYIKAKKGDTIVFSSSPIIGNEHAINKLVNAFSIMGCNVINNQMAEIHTSGHGKQDELIQMINYVKPKYLIPIHGEFYMRRALGDLAVKHCNIPESNILMLNNGSIATGEQGNMYKDSKALIIKDMIIDGNGEGKIDSQVIVDRKAMAKNGLVTILVYISGKGKQLKGSPEIISRGFIYQHESEEVNNEISHLAREAFINLRKKNPGAGRNDMKNYIREIVKRYAIKEWNRTPLILPIIIDC